MKEVLELAGVGYEQHCLRCTDAILLSLKCINGSMLFTQAMKHGYYFICLTSQMKLSKIYCLSKVLGKYNKTDRYWRVDTNNSQQSGRKTQLGPLELCLVSDKSLIPLDIFIIT